MARTNPHYDWDGANGAGEHHHSNGAEWESLRNELVALLDQVEDQVAGVQTAPVRRPEPEPAPSPAPKPESQGTRHIAALRTVREAVDRLAERSDTPPPARRSSVADAVNQIRARQSGSAKPEPQSPPQAQPSTGATAVEFAGFAQAVSALGQRIEAFEAKVSSQIDALDKGDFSAQIAQLSEVIEMLAAAVGESGQVKRIEAQISNLAEMVANGAGRSEDHTAARLEELTETVEKLVNHQVQASGRDEQLAAEANDRQARAMEQIEQSVRNIYDRIDALETSQPSSAGDVERISRDMAALTQAVQDQAEPKALLARIDALDERISALGSGPAGEAETLRDSITVLRDVVAEALEPRFSALETRINALGEGTSDAGGSGLETQLRTIAQRVEETSTQLASLAAQHEHASATGIQPGLDELERRLTKLFAGEDGAGQPTSEHLAGVKNSIAQVDNRIARLEAMLNGQTRPLAPRAADSAEPEEPATPEAPKGRSKPADEMPRDAVTGEPRRVLGENPAHVAGAFAGLEPEPQPKSQPKPFRIDPEAVEKPAKPQSSFAIDGESPFGGRFRDVPADETGEQPVSANRSSFIEAARRSARQHLDTVEAEEPKSLIGRAIARFQRNAAQEEAGGANTVASEEIAKAEHAVTGPSVADEVDPVSPREDMDAEDEAAPGFLTRNRRALLLGSALVVVVALSVPLVMSRLGGPAPTQQVEAPETAEISAPPQSEEPPASEISSTKGKPEPETVSDADGLTSDVRMIEQNPVLSAARVDRDAFSAGQAIDPVVTAAIGPEPDRVIERTGTPAAAADAAANMPPISVPQEIEPAQLREAAEAGNPRAQFEVGAILTEGHVVEQDLAAAAQWYQRSAAQGFAPAQYRLGSLYESGQGVEKDLEAAKLWYERAARLGNRMSMHNLASLHAGGELETQDFAAAAKWFEEAAAQGLTDSQFNLGMLYARGLGVEQNFEKSFIWFSLAARSGDEDAIGARDDVARSLDAETVQRLNDQLADWLPAEIDMAANFAPIGTWDEKFDPGPGIENSDVILQVQMLLNKLGYEVGTPDGIIGPKTREAIAAFERATGMNESGAVNPRLLAVLGSQPV